MQTYSLADIQKADSEQRFETARRMLLKARAEGMQDSPESLWADYSITCHLGDPRAALSILQRIASLEGEGFDYFLALADVHRHLLGYDLYQTSDEAAGGMGYETYAQNLRDSISAEIRRAISLLPSEPTSEAFRRIARTCHGCGLWSEAEKYRGMAKAAADAESGACDCCDAASDAPAPTGSVAGRLLLPDGSPAAGCTVVLGLAVEMAEKDPTTYDEPEMHYMATIGEVHGIETTADADGRYRFDSVPAGRHSFLAARLDPAKFEIATRFFRLGLDVAENEETVADALLDEWRSARPEPFPDRLPDLLMVGETAYRKVQVERLRNPFDYDFPRQPYHFAPRKTPSKDARVAVLDPRAKNGAPLFLDWQMDGGKVICMPSLPMRSDRLVGLYDTVEACQCLGTDVSSVCNLPADAAPLSRRLAITPDEDCRTAVIDTGAAQFRIAWGCASGDDGVAPLCAVKAVDGVWRGRGHFVLPEGVAVESRSTEVLESGPVMAKVRIEHLFTGGEKFVLELTAYAGEACLCAREIPPAKMQGAFEFSLAEFIGGRCYAYWGAESGTPHWRTMDKRDREFARLQESIMWWRSNCDFGYSMTPDSLDERDYIGVVTLRRGEWIDRYFDSIAHGPTDGNRELDWPYPEMVGSTVSMITGNTSADGDAFFRFKFFDGERQWGLVASSIVENDGPEKEIYRSHHKFGSPRLDDFARWDLDPADAGVRPSVVARRSDLISLRAKREDPAFAESWKRIRKGVPGPAVGLGFAIDGDPLIAWRKKLELTGVARIRSRMTLLGREHSDMYSPVGARPITSWAEDYDLIAASGCFTPEEERRVRRFLLLMGHMYMEKDFMNWGFGARNANFEADRVDVVGTVGLVFAGHPGADAMADHAAERTRVALDAYCTPGSGKWYENPACYYLQALKCRVNLLYHLWRDGRLDPSSIERLRDFMRWGAILLTPPFPTENDRMGSALTDSEYRALPSSRRLPPIGDHATLGTPVPEHFALMAQALRESDPELSALLCWAYRNGGSTGKNFGNLPLYFASLDAKDLEPVVPPKPLASRRLEGFGAVFRGGFGTGREFYLLFKQGPGGYRYHNTEGGILLFSDCKPLLYDGGEAGETWRHTTLSFHDAHTPLAPGHVERFASLPEADFCQGVHPKALDPGEPTFLSDCCEDRLVQVAFDRFNEPNPADSRSVCWVKDAGYVVVHDELRLPPGVTTHWHAQPVSDAHEVAAPGDYRFRGRYGTDLQILLPGQRFDEEEFRQDALLLFGDVKPFTMRHLRLAAKSPAGIVAVFRPLAPGDKPVSAAALRQADGRIVGARVSGEGFDDFLFFSRAPIEWDDTAAGGVRFSGRYGLFMRRAGGERFVDLDRKA